MKGLFILLAIWVVVVGFYIYRWVMEEPGRA